jgi:hypothetical protein
MRQDVTLLVNTCDAFADCWNPFFTLLRAHWPGCDWPIVLNTEHLAYEHEGLDIRSARVAEGSATRPTWSECLMRCLEGVHTPFVLYMQEDYFLEAPVRTQALQGLVELMHHEQADVIRIMECGGAGPWHPSPHPWLWEVDARSPYRISLQAGLWRTQVLARQLRRHESPWQLEVFGSGRARRRSGERVMCVNRDLFHGPGQEILPYTPTGIVKGRWERHIVTKLFERHGIEMDFTQRGFTDEETPPAARAPLLKRLTDRVRSLA